MMMYDGSYDDNIWFARWMQMTCYWRALLGRWRDDLEGRERGNAYTKGTEI